MFASRQIDYNQPMKEIDVYTRLDQLEKLAIVQAREINELRKIIGQLQQHQQQINDFDRPQTNINNRNFGRNVNNRNSLLVFREASPGRVTPTAPLMSAKSRGAGSGQPQMQPANFHQPLYQMSRVVHPTSAIPPINADISFCDSAGSSTSPPLSTMPSSSLDDQEEPKMGSIGAFHHDHRGERIKRQSLIENHHHHQHLQRAKLETSMNREETFREREEGELSSSSFSGDDSDQNREQDENANRNQAPKKKLKIDNSRQEPAESEEMEPIYVTFRKSNTGVISTLYFKDKEQTQPVEEPVYLESANTWIFSKEQTSIRMPKSLRQLLKNSPFQ